MVKHLSIASLLMIAASGASAQKIHVNVKDSHGAPLKDVKITSTAGMPANWSAMTDANGEFDGGSDLGVTTTSFNLKFEYKGTDYTVGPFKKVAGAWPVIAPIVVSTNGVEVKTLDNNDAVVATATVEVTPSYIQDIKFIDPATGAWRSEFFPTNPNGDVTIKVSSAGTWAETTHKIADNKCLKYKLSKVNIPGTAIHNDPEAGVAEGKWFDLGAGQYVLQGERSIRIRSTDGVYTRTKLTVGNADINKSALLVRLVKSTFDPSRSRDGATHCLKGGEVSYYENGWVAAPEATNSNGYALVITDVAPENLYTQVSYLGANQIKYAQFAGNTVQYQTSNYKVSFISSKGDNLDPASIEYYANGWKTFDVNPNIGTSEKELLPYDYYFQLGYKGASQMKYLSREKSTILFQTRGYVVNFKSSDNKPLVATSLNYYVNGWKAFTPTTNGVAKMELLPYGYYFQLGFGGTTEQRYLPETDSVVNYSTKAVAINVKDCGGNYKTEASNPQYYANDGWRVFAAMSNGSANRELLPGNYYFNVELNGTNQQLYGTIVNDTTIVYVATKATAVAEHNIQSAQYYSNTGWRDMTRSGSTASVYVLPGSYYFLVDGTQTYKAVEGCSTDVNFYDYGTYSRMIAANKAFAVYPNPTNDFINVSMPEAGTISIYSVDGKQVAAHKLTAGENRIDVSSLITGTYVLVNGTETIKFVKQ